jgi:hypothetical protein
MLSRQPDWLPEEGQQRPPDAVDVHQWDQASLASSFNTTMLPLPATNEWDMDIGAAAHITSNAGTLSITHERQGHQGLRRWASSCGSTLRCEVSLLQLVELCCQVEGSLLATTGKLVFETRKMMGAMMSAERTSWRRLVEIFVSTTQSICT